LLALLRAQHLSAPPRCRAVGDGRLFWKPMFAEEPSITSQHVSKAVTTRTSRSRRPKPKLSCLVSKGIGSTRPGRRGVNGTMIDRIKADSSVP
jgi:hypothetical protein